MAATISLPSVREWTRTIDTCAATCTGDEVLKMVLDQAIRAENYAQMVWVEHNDIISRNAVVVSAFKAALHDLDLAICRGLARIELLKVVRVLTANWEREARTVILTGTTPTKTQHAIEIIKHVMSTRPDLVCGGHRLTAPTSEALFGGKRRRWPWQRRAKRADIVLLEENTTWSDALLKTIESWGALLVVAQDLDDVPRSVQDRATVVNLDVDCVEDA